MIINPKENIEKNVVTKIDIVAGLKELGIKAGMGLMVHSSLAGFGYVEGGAETVIHALMEVLTPEGTLLMPSFNHAEPFLEDGSGLFDPQKTPTRNGKIPDTFWRMPGVHRSLNPTHPFAAWGKNAIHYTKFHHRTLTMGPGSPLGLLYKDGGSCLLIGVYYSSNTFHHFVEESTGAPCLGQRTEAYPVILPDGHIVEGRTWGWRENDCPFTDGNRYYDIMESRGLHKKTVVGSSTLTLYKLNDCYEVVAELFRNGRDGYPPCSKCKIRPEKVRWTVPSDWDSEKQCIKPDSEAWSY
jgi:aminoglycoside N3'-acetyltransferase